MGLAWDCKATDSRQQTVAKENQTVSSVDIKYALLFKFFFRISSKIKKIRGLR